MPRTRPTSTPFTDFTLDFTPMRRLRRAKFEWRMKDLAKAVGSHPSTIYRLETNKVTEPSARLVIALGRALGVQPYELYTVLDRADGR